MINNDFKEYNILYQDQSVKFNNISYLLVTVNKSVEDLSIFPAMSAIEVNSQEVYINYNNTKEYYKTLMFTNYTMGIILSDNIFLKYDYSLKMYPPQINNRNLLTSVNISLRTQFKDFLEFPKEFKFISINNQHLQPINLPCNITNIDYKKKMIDLSISHFYEII